MRVLEPQQPLLRAGRRCLEAETQMEARGADTVVRRVEQELGLAHITSPQMTFDDAPPPGVRCGIAQRAENAPELHGLHGTWAQPELAGLERYRIRSAQILRVVDECAQRHAAAARLFEVPRGHHLEGPGQRQVHIDTHQKSSSKRAGAGPRARGQSREDTCLN